MNPALVVLMEAQDLGVTIRIAGPDRLRIRGPRAAVTRLHPSITENKSGIIAELQTALPVHVRLFLLMGGYESKLSAWTPAACRTLLDLLEDEWGDFKVCGWQGCQMPETWTWPTISAVLSIYSQSIQLEVPCQ